MNEIINAIITRRSCKNFKPDMVPTEIMDQIIEAGLFAASGKGKQAPIIIAITDKDTMTYTYYQQYVKPKKQAPKGYVCKICGYVYEGDTLPKDYICPICKHPASDFEKC